ncbi:MAG: hypothetical protein IPJ41_02545 [Phycisphaerales bacterium]|nr:hypothetical protein [Phycisphaerales bacterium]
MEAFWQFAGRMLRYRATIVWAMVFAVLSAGGLGVGLVSIAPVLRIILARPAAISTQAQSETGAQRARQESSPQLQDGTVPTPESLRRGPDATGEDDDGSRGLPGIARSFNAQIPDFLSFVRVPERWIGRLPPGRFTAVVAIVSVLGALTLFGGVANFLHAYLSLTVVYRTLTNIRREAFHRVVRLPLKTVVTGGSSDLVSRIVNDTNQLSQGFATLLSRTVAQATKGVAGLLAAVFIEPVLVLAALPVTALLYVVIRRLGKKIRRASRGALRSQAGLFGTTTEVLQGLRVVKVYTTERYEAGRFHRINRQFMHEMMRVRLARALASPLVEVLSIFALGLLSLIAAKAIIDNKLDPENFIAALMALGAAGASLKPITGLINEIQASSAAAQRLQELLAEPVESGHSLRLPKLGRHAESIQFDRVDFTYPGATPGPPRGLPHRQARRARRHRRPQRVRQDDAARPRSPPLRSGRGRE